MFGRNRSTRFEKQIEDRYGRLLKIQGKQSEVVLNVLESMAKLDSRFESMLPTEMTVSGGKEDWVDSINQFIGKIDSGALDELLGDDADGKAIKLAIKTIKKPFMSFLEKRKDIVNPILSAKLEKLAMGMIAKRETPTEEQREQRVR
mgnify:FL=1